MLDIIILIEKYREYQKDGLKETKDILKFTKNYKETNDIYLQYIEERTEKSEKHIHTSTLYADFKRWFVENNPRTKIPSNRVFVANLRNHMIVEQVSVDNKSSTGVKNIRTIRDELEFY